LLRDAGRPREAIPAYQAAIRLRLDWPEAHIDLAGVHQELDEPAQAIEHYRQALRLKPDAAVAEYSMAAALTALGRVDEAEAAYERAAVSSPALYGNPITVLLRETLAEVIPANQRAIVDYRNRVHAALRTFVDEPGSIDLANLHTRGATPSLMLAYFGGDVRPILEQYARAIGPHIPQFPLRRRQGKPRLGIVVTSGHEWGFAQCWGGIAERLSRELFEVAVICSPMGANALQSMLKLPRDEYVVMPAGVAEAARRLHDQSFDWLHYWEIGTDATNYYLPFFQPAPGQSNCWGWPVTSGNQRVDAYLSCEQVEPQAAARHYTETLVLFKNLPVCFVRPAESGHRLPRSHFGLEDGRRLYVCTQNVRKFHPDFDPLLADLLRTDPQGSLLIFADAQSNITNLLINRFRRTMPDVAARVRVMRRMSRAEYLSLLAVSDVALDTLYFGGGVTVYDAVAAGIPLVTLPGDLQRTRWAAAINRRLGVPELIAASPQEYVAKAVEVASNADLRQALSQQLLRAGAELFEAAVVVQEHEEYFAEAIARKRS
jgi:predicted O-linked N-acetylglucosamine transferase (SPINDLY family)